MAFPTTLDTTSTIPVEASGTSLATNHVTNHTASQTAIIALETKVGVDGSAVTTTHDYKLSGVTGSDKAVSKTGTETLTNKTLTAPTVTGATITTSTVNGVTLQTAGAATDFLAANGSYVAGSVSNATTSAKGIVELATSAEITAGTATGSTGAALAVTPDALASSTPVFNGSSLTAIPRWLASGAPATTVSNTTTTVLTYAVAGGTLSTNKGIRIRLSTSTTNTAVNGTLTINVKYGGTTVATYGYSGVTGTPTFTSVHVADIIIFGSGATGTQHASGIMSQSGTTFSPICSPLQGTSSVDSTASQNLTVDIISSASAVVSTFTDYIIDKIV